MSDQEPFDLQEMLDNYAFSSPYGAVQVGEHWIRQGKPVEEAAEIAIKYAMGEVEASGANKKRLMQRLNRSRAIIEEMMAVIAEAHDVEDPRE